MANRLNKNPLVVDTTDATIPGPLSIVAIAWTSTAVTNRDIAADDDLTIKEASANGQILLAKRAEAAGDGLELNFGSHPWKAPHGLYVEDIDGGELHLFLE